MDCVGIICRVLCANFFYFCIMESKKSKITTRLKLQIALIALVMPVVGAVSGWYYAFFIGESDYPYAFALACLGVGMLLDVVCYNGGVFSFVFYKLPIPLVLALMSYAVASFFVSWRLALCAGILGVFIGIVFDYALVIDKPFYLARKRVLVIVYMLLSFIMLGIMMGVPVSSFLLGIMAGNYYSLRYEGAVLSKARLKRNLLIVSWFVTVVLLLLEVMFGWLIWQDSPNIIAYVHQLTGLLITHRGLLAMIFGFGAFAVVIQFFLTYYTGKIMLSYRTIRYRESH